MSKLSNFEILKDAIKQAKKAGVDNDLLEKTFNVGLLEKEEDENCPAMLAYAQSLMEISTKRKGSNATYLQLLYILDIREQHFKYNGDVNRIVRSPR